jgi:hypothetical protein
MRRTVGAGAIRRRVQDAERKPLLDDKGKPAYAPTVEFVEPKIRYKWRPGPSRRLTNSLQRARVVCGLNERRAGVRGG